MNHCDVCYNTVALTDIEIDDEREIRLCSECYNSSLTPRELYNIVRERRWKQTKSEKRWNAGQEITDADRGIEPTA